MAHLINPIVIRHSLPDGKAVAKGIPGARKVRERTKYRSESSSPRMM
jgi:hypothetical protein